MKTWYPIIFLSYSFTLRTWQAIWQGQTSQCEFWVWVELIALLRPCQFSLSRRERLIINRTCQYGWLTSWSPAVSLSKWNNRESPAARPKLEWEVRSVWREERGDPRCVCCVLFSLLIRSYQLLRALKDNTASTRPQGFLSQLHYKPVYTHKTVSLHNSHSFNTGITVFHSPSVQFSFYSVNIVFSVFVSEYMTY